MRTEKGKQFPSSAYLLVGDPEKPASWNVRVEETPGKLTAAQLGRAYTELTKGEFVRVQTTEDHVQDALKKLRTLYRKLEVPWPANQKNQDDFGGLDNLPNWLAGFRPAGRRTGVGPDHQHGRFGCRTWMTNPASCISKARRRSRTS